MKYIIAIILIIIIILTLASCINISTTTESHTLQTNQQESSLRSNEPEIKEQKYAGIYTDEDVIYKDTNVTIIKRGFDPAGGQYGPEVNLYIINNTNNEYLIQTRDFKVNGIEVTTIFSKQINPKEKDLADLIIWRNDLRTHFISLIETIEFSFFFLNNNNLDNPYQTETITLKLK